MTKEVDRCYRQIFWSEEVGGLWKMIQRKRNLGVRWVLCIRFTNEKAGAAADASAVAGVIARDAE